MDYSILDGVLILLATAVVAVSLFRRLHLPPILAYLSVGIAVGPHGLGWIANDEDTRLLAEFGVVFLLFTVGLEFSLPQLIAMRREVLGLGSAQVVLTGAVAGGVAWAVGIPPTAALVVGGVLAMSSTAIVIKQLNEQLELNSRHGRNAVGVLLFQDVAVPPFLIIIPVLVGGGEMAILTELAWAMLKGSLFIGLMLAAGHWLLRPLFRTVTASRSAELFTLTALLVTLAAAWASHSAGLSLALGAFIAGVMLGETEFRHQVEADIRPFQDVLLGLFFITVGMLFDLHALPAIGHWVLLALLGVVLYKALLVAALGRLMGEPADVAVRTGIVLAQGGEFGFALLALAVGVGLFDHQVTQVLLATLILSMLLAPFLLRHSGAIVRRLFAETHTSAQQAALESLDEEVAGLHQHVLICGYGRVGQSVARIVEQEGHDTIALDLDPVRVAEAREAGERVIYGDATHREILDAAGLTRARAVIIAIGSNEVALRIIRLVRSIDAELPVLVRTRDEADLERLLQAGASEIVPDSLEASLMLAGHLLTLLEVPMSRIVRQLQAVRGDRYRLLRSYFHGQEPEALGAADTFRERLHTVTLPNGAYAVDCRLGELGLEGKGVVVTAVRRGGIRGKQPVPEMVLHAGDSLVLYGNPEDLEHAEARLLRG